MESLGGGHGGRGADAVTLDTQALRTSRVLLVRLGHAARPQPRLCIVLSGRMGGDGGSIGDDKETRIDLAVSSVCVQTFAEDGRTAQIGDGGDVAGGERLTRALGTALGVRIVICGARRAWDGWKRIRVHEAATEAAFTGRSARWCQVYGWAQRREQYSAFGTQYIRHGVERVRRLAARRVRRSGTRDGSRCRW
jgi:hypothetical protein